MGLYAKYKRRDSELPRHREKIMHSIEKDLILDQNVLSVFYGGSIGENSTDLFSDIDLRIIVNDKVFEEYRLNKKERAKKWGNVLFFEDNPRASHTVAHYINFIKVDAFYYRSQQLQPSVWLQNIKIVHDMAGVMLALSEKSKGLTYQPALEEVESWRNKFFAYVHEIYRRVSRGEIYYALHCLDNLRISIVTAWHMEAGLQPNTFGDWARLQGTRSKLETWQLKLLEEWFSSPEPSEIMKVMTSMFPEFRRVHACLCHRVGLEENDVLAEKVLGMVNLDKESRRDQWRK
ncbi:aminoglycoside 6-adenylyltransferase [Cytobacillus oceanisediminis]|uniref:aminoglycoside 6-adenylyltransferase n=1 Tax=Cytobacillus oceanisediminis TaxID=665099 RepID=UPI00207A60C0|nr:aminoglycoside 6-adenylyltransferase [Cytobacillus oceanisediminis]MCS0824144.1 aminoglycoside 6-adenylyltransferase [Cytobacillus firmus]USK42526.1 aminoglycoside 6-adenylyltransferase [Cytobacillus oceanisediminis]